ncbi:ankyrin repeat domain-containing protein [Luteimonas sp. MC1750]|uniref:ankyrin repeat domain-containing protein n=1 Tax=Luteimonas sp. MC1750 TaxID=2799326 RepID=UPI0018F0D1A1|nr:ankyrin repeat domain-containing protein [Luteimonas sp. MC1750]MBJ6983982.1 ankyrin repeat domain-containing protein [Luteimonas sp. MC1750]QQO06794.1 ankyrin repeat domain-containing protein [Luteimonas sp. MC1750]
MFDYEQDPEGLESFLRGGGTVNEQISQGGTLLHTARDPAIAQVLLDYDLDLESTNGDGETALLYAVSLGDRDEYAAWLLEQGAQVNVYDSNGCFPILLTQSPELTSLLIEAGADVSCRDNEGMTPLHMAHNADRATLLIDAGADVNAATDDDETPLSMAKSVAVSALLLDAGADVNARTSTGRTALHVANSGDQARVLISAGADVHAQDVDGQTALFVSGRNLEVARELVAAGADISHKDAGGKTAADYNPPAEVAAFLESYKRVQALEKLAGISRPDDNLATPEQALAARQARYGRSM